MADRKRSVRACMLLLLLPLSVSPSRGSQQTGVTKDILGELASHLGVSTRQLTDDRTRAESTWHSLVSFQRRLVGAGFHRTLELQLGLGQTENALSIRSCSLAVLQPLPSSIFADPYQLEDLTRAGVQHAAGYGYTFKLLGPLDLELPAPACQDTALLLALNASLQQDQQDHTVTLRVPLHAKYPQPQAFGYQGWRWVLTGHVAAELPWPLLLVDCRQQQGAVTLIAPPSNVLEQQQGMCSSPSSSEGSETACSSTDTPAHGGSSTDADSLVWLVPAGNLDHEVLVSWGTLLVTAACCIAVSWSASKAAFKAVGRQCNT